MHERVDRGDQASRGKVRVEYSLPLKSSELGLTGKADVVEFHLSEHTENRWIPFPVEYKRGKPKKDWSDKVQLCAQALCLEEMLDTKVEQGALFYGKTRRRQNVGFDDSLRKLTFETANKLHELFVSGITPLPHFSWEGKMLKPGRFMEINLWMGKRPAAGTGPSNSCLDQI